MADEVDPQELVVVFTGTTPGEAELIHNLLEAEGIRSEVGGENQAGLSGVLYEVQVLVKAEDADRAEKLIAQHPHRRPGG